MSALMYHFWPYLSTGITVAVIIALILPDANGFIRFIISLPVIFFFIYFYDKGKKEDLEDELRDRTNL